MVRQIKQVKKVRIPILIAKFPTVTFTNTQITNQIMEANKIWAKCGIEFFANGIVTIPVEYLTGFPTLECAITTAAMTRVGNVVRVLNNYFSNNLVVIYTNSQFKIEGGKRPTGCTYGKAINRNDRSYLGITTYLAKDAQKEKYVLAHELGHALFFGKEGFAMEQPSPSKGDPYHSSLRGNIMYTPVQTISATPVTVKQCELINKNGLLVDRYK